MDSTVCFRVDASVEIGTGHVMRCLALADALRMRAVASRFICTEHPGHLADRITESGHAVELLRKPRADWLPTEPGTYRHWLGRGWREDLEQTVAACSLPASTSWFVVDHYALDAEWERGLRQAGMRVLAIDDLANRPHDCELLVDASPGRAESDYDGITPPAVRRLLGPRYALLRPRFADRRPASLERRRTGTLQRLLVSLGGSDPDNATGDVLDALDRCELPHGCRVLVVVGPRSPWRAALENRAAALRHPCEILFDVRDMAELMERCDLAIGAGGGTALERCALGLPSLIMILADNQRRGATALAELGAALPLDVVGVDLARRLAEVQAGNRLATIAEGAAKVTDGLGLERVIAAMDLVA